MNRELPSQKKEDYKSKEARAQGYNQALQNFQGKNLGQFLNQYGHLLDDDDVNLSMAVSGNTSIANKNVGQSMGMSNISNLVAGIDDDDDTLPAEMSNMFSGPEDKSVLN